MEAHDDLVTLNISRGEWRDPPPVLCRGQAPWWLEHILHWERRPQESLLAYGTPWDEPMPTKLDPASPQ